MNESKEHAILDTRCSSTVCGIIWCTDYINDLTDHDRSKISEENSSKTFTFGNGVAVASMKRVTIPCFVAGLRSEIITDVVDCDIPLLLSKDAMKRANMVLRFRDDTVTVNNLPVKLDTSTSGHYMLPISM